MVEIFQFSCTSHFKVYPLALLLVSDGKKLKCMKFVHISWIAGTYVKTHWICSIMIIPVWKLTRNCFDMNAYWGYCTSSSKYYSCNFVLFRICWAFDAFFPSPSTTQNHDTLKIHNFAFDHIIYASPWVFILANEQTETCLLIWILFIVQWKIFR